MTKASGKKSTKTRRSKRVRIKLEMDDYTLDFLKRVRKLSQVSMSGVVSVILSLKIIRDQLNSPPAESGSGPPKA